MMTNTSRLWAGGAVTVLALLVGALAAAHDRDSRAAIALSTSRGEMDMTDRGLPHQVIMLETAIEKMERYRREHLVYAHVWYLLDIQTACGGMYRVSDPDTRPKPSDGARWRPKNCKSTYVIQRADATHVLIQAINDRGEVEYEIEQGMKEARPVNPPKD